MAYQAFRPNDDTDRTLWMGDLSPDWDQTFIAESFARMGEEITNVKIVFDKHSGKVAFISVINNNIIKIHGSLRVSKSTNNFEENIVLWWF